MLMPLDMLYSYRVWSSLRVGSGNRDDRQAHGDTQTYLQEERGKGKLDRYMLGGGGG